MANANRPGVLHSARSSISQLTVKLSQLNVDTNNDFCHRHEGFATEDSIKVLAESIVAEGLHTPLMVAESGTAPDGTKQYRIIGGHRRYSAIQKAIRERLDFARINEEMDIPVVEVVPEKDQDKREFDMDLLCSSIGDNAVRADFTNEERLSIVRKCRDQGVPNPRAALALGLSETQFNRLVAVVETPWLLKMVYENCIGMTHASSLIQATKSPEQNALLKKGLVRWIAEKQKILEKERADFEKVRKKLSGISNTVKKYMDGKLVQHWIKCIELNSELSNDPAFQFGILVDKKAGTITVPAMQFKIQDHSEATLVAMIGELQKGAENSVGMLRQKQLLDSANTMTPEEQREVLQRISSEYEETNRQKENAEAGREPTDESFDFDKSSLGVLDLGDEFSGAEAE
ncbi:MAG: ParB N-terminal domain-containing protein [Pirellulaceae bacterium]|nr:ParB N-terminal domain-containing protein [Pirellulaceae bacterium]